MAFFRLVASDIETSIKPKLHTIQEKIVDWWIGGLVIGGLVIGVLVYWYIGVLVIGVLGRFSSFCSLINGWMGE